MLILLEPAFVAMNVRFIKLHSSTIFQIESLCLFQLSTECVVCVICKANLTV